MKRRVPSGDSMRSLGGVVLNIPRIVLPIISTFVTLSASTS